MTRGVQNGEWVSAKFRERATTWQTVPECRHLCDVPGIGKKNALPGGRTQDRGVKGDLTPRVDRRHDRLRRNIEAIEVAATRSR